MSLKSSRAGYGPSLEEAAQSELASLGRRHPTVLASMRESLTQYLLRVSPQYVNPTHLAPLVTELEKINRGEEVLLVCSSPPRGAKTETLLHSLSWLLTEHPDWELGYTSYNATQARSKSAKGLTIAGRAALPLVSKAVTNWRTEEGGGVIARGVGEGVTGQGLDVTVVDDPHKDRAEVESELKRNRVWDWFNEALYTRRNPSSLKHPRPRSIIVNMARWHPDDLAGRLIKMGWKHINIPAISDDGRSFWPELWPLKELQAIRKQLGEYSFTSLYQGAPRPRGGTVFGDPWTWSELPKTFQSGMGLDLSYSKKTHADYSVIVVMLRDTNGFCYVVDVKRVQTRAPEFMDIVQQHKARYPHARARWYAYGPEIGIADFIDKKLNWLETISVPQDKFIRAQPVAAAWNASKVFVPEDSEKYPWVTQFLDEVLNFTGVADVHDDQVDALAAAYDLLEAPVGYHRAPSSPRRM